MKKNLRAGYILIFISIALIFNQCRKDPSWESEYIVPLFQDKLTLNHLFGDTAIKADTDGTAIVVIDKDITNITTDMFVDLPDSLYYFKYTLPFGIQVPPGTLVLSKTESKFFNLGGPELTQIRLKSGYLRLTAYNYVRDQAYIEYKLENAHLNGAPIKLTGILPSYPLTGKCLKDSIPINGVFIDLTATPHRYNSILSSFKVFANPNADTNIVLNYNDSIIVLVEFRQVVIDYARGYFGSTEINVDENNDFSLFRDLGVDYLDFDHINAKITLANYIGSDAIFRIEQFKGIGKQTISLQSPWMGKNLYLSRAIENPPFSGQVIPTKINLDLNNSNIEEFIENLPHQLQLKIEGKINPFGNISSGNDFVYYGSGLNFHLYAEIPLRLAFSNITLQDTVNYNFPNIDPLSIEEAHLHIHYSNSFPIDNVLKLYILHNNNILDSIIPSNPLRGGMLDSQGKVIAPHEDKILISLPTNKINTLKQGNKLILQARFATNNGHQKVKISPANYLSLNVKTQVKTKVE